MQNATHQEVVPALARVPDVVSAVHVILVSAGAHNAVGNLWGSRTRGAETTGGAGSTDCTRRGGGCCAGCKAQKRQQAGALLPQTKARRCAVLNQERHAPSLPSSPQGPSSSSKQSLPRAKPALITRKTQDITTVNETEELRGHCPVPSPVTVHQKRREGILTESARASEPVEVQPDHLQVALAVELPPGGDARNVPYPRPVREVNSGHGKDSVSGQESTQRAASLSREKLSDRGKDGRRQARRAIRGGKQGEPLRASGSARAPLEASGSSRRGPAASRSSSPQR